MAGNSIKGLAKDTAIYGISSILGRVFNWALVPLHIYVFTNPVEYGYIGQLYGYTALFLVLLTYGMETGFFRFMNKDGEDSEKVYSTSLISLATTSSLFILLCISFINPISEYLRYEYKEHIMMMAIVIALDAFMTIPFAYLRYKKRPVKFMVLKMTFIAVNILFNLLFLIVFPWMLKTFPDFPLNKFYHPDFGVGYVFLANLIASLTVLILLIPSTMKGLKLYFDNSLLKRILKYSFPLLILGLAGVINQVVAPLTYPRIFEDPERGKYELGIYSACIKFTVIISLFIQAFRYAYEPFIFGKNREGDHRDLYAKAMKYFVIFALFIFLGVMYYIDIIQFIMEKIGKNYVVGLDILPPAMMGEIFFGIYFNLSIWYKLTDNTRYGAYFSILGCIIQVAMNIILVPIYGYIMSAWATFACNLIIMTISYFVGQKYFPIKYDLKNILFYFVLAGIFYFIAMYIPIENDIIRLSYRTILLVIFGLIIVKKDVPLSEIPIINRYIKKKN